MHLIRTKVRLLVKQIKENHTFLKKNEELQYVSNMSLAIFPSVHWVLPNAHKIFKLRARFGTPNENYIRNNNLYYWEKKKLY